MPLDETRWPQKSQALAKMDELIGLLDDERKWCQKELRTRDGRLCIAGGMMAVGGTADLKLPIARAIRQVTRRNHDGIEAFNDHDLTTHPLVVEVLRQARANILCPPAEHPRVKSPGACPRVKSPGACPRVKSPGAGAEKVSALVRATAARGVTPLRQELRSVIASGRSAMRSIVARLHRAEHAR